MADAKFPEFVRSTEYRRELGMKRKRAIRKMYSDIAAETEKKIRDIERAGKWSGTTVLQMKQLRDLQKSIEASLKKLGSSLEKDILSDMKKIAEVTCTDVAGFLRRSGAGVGISLANVPDKVVRNIASGNIYGQRWTFSKAIWNDYNKASGDLALIVSKGLAAQKPIYDIAKDLEKYVNPAVRKDYDWSRLYPGSKKKVDHNAYRLAQTMSTHAHQQAVIISCKEDPLVDGVEWRSSGSSRVCPLCEQRNGEVFPLDKCPMDHPMGQCILIPHIKKAGDDPHRDAADAASDSFEREFRERQRQTEEAKKQLTSSGNGGIMNFRESQSLYTEVTKESLDNIPHVNYFSAELNEKYRQVNSLLLKEVQKHDVGVEISAICNDKMELIGGFTVGTYGSVKIPDSNDIYYAFHNHPSGETFSPEDLMNFIKRKNMLSLTAQGNNGKGNYCILKTPESDSMGYSNFLNSKTEECIYFFENQKYSYAMMKKGELDLSLLNDKQISELQDIIKNFGEECARGSEKFGYKYFKGTT